MVNCQTAFVAQVLFYWILVGEKWAQVGVPFVWQLDLTQTKKQQTNRSNQNLKLQHGMVNAKTLFDNIKSTHPEVAGEH